MEGILAKSKRICYIYTALVFIAQLQHLYNFSVKKFLEWNKRGVSSQQ